MAEPSTGEFESSKENFTSKYTELTGRNQVVDREIWSTEWVLSEYVKRTDGLIGKMDGTIPMIQQDIYTTREGELTAEKRDLKPPSSVIYLDKSARPVEWMVRELWPVLARVPDTPYAEGKVPQKPKDYFLNIDKGDWLRRMGVPEEHIQDVPENLIDITKIDKEHIARIRALYSTAKIDEDNIDDAWNNPTIFDGQHVMVVDEVKSSGKTLKLAQMLLSLAIPEATFSGEYWAKPLPVFLNNGVEVDGRMQKKMAWVPVWYREDSPLGRGIGDRNEDWPEITEKKGYPVSRYAKLGRYVLSTPPHDENTDARISDKKARRIREDIKHMAVDLKFGRILYRPSQDRPTEDQSDFEKIEDRITSINNVDMKTWQSKRDAIKPTLR